MFTSASAAFVAILLVGQVHALELSQCIAPLGMETGAIEDSALSASSSFEHSTVGPQNARVRVDKNGGAWCPKSMIGKEGHEWLEIDLGRVHVISATETQGRFGNGHGVEFTEAYMLEYYRPRLGKWVRYRKRSGGDVLDGNKNTYVAVKNDLDPVILASKIRFHPYNNYQRTICMRVEVYGCTWDDGLISYSMPQGDQRGSAYEFYDWTYDGEWKGEQLINGLGCLTDGDFGPDSFKLSYYAESRGWVGWKQNDDREMIEIVFEFDTVREFHSVHIFTNNQFSREVSLFKEMRVHFSIGGDIYPGEPVFYSPMEDTIFEKPRNVSAKLHRRVGRFAKVQLFFASKWIMISEVSFDTSKARGNFTPEKEESHRARENVVVLDHVAPEQVPEKEVESETSAADNKEKNNPETALMPIVIGVLIVVILCLAAIIFVIVKRSRHKKWLDLHGRDDGGTGTMAGDLLGSEKLALAYGHPHAHGYMMTNTVSSDTNSSGHSSCRQPPHPYAMNTSPPKLDDNYNSPHHAVIGTPRLYSVSNRNGTGVQSQMITPKGTRRNLPPVPRLTVPPPPSGPPPPPSSEGEAVYTEPGTYTEPYRALRYSPYYGYGPVMSEIEDTLMKQSLLSEDTSCGVGGDYAVPMDQQRPRETSKAAAVSRINLSPAGVKKRPVTASTTSTTSTASSSAGDSLKAMKARLETHVVPEISRTDLTLHQRLSQGSFGTVFVAEAMGLPEYGTTNAAASRQDNNKTLVAVKFLGETAGDQEKTDFIREVRLLSVLDDVNIARVLGLCSTQEPFFVAMEYLEHGDLNRFLRAHASNNNDSGSPSLGMGTLMHLASQIASGMRYLESLNFVHRDLATRNCLVGQSYHLKICDFGSDNPEYSADYFEMDNHLLIPIRWMAWESVLMCKYTTKSDVWSFGVCLWEILTLATKRPYAELSDHAVLDHLRRMQDSSNGKALCLERPTSSRCPKDLYELMKECWRRDPHDRPTFREIHLFLQRKNLGFSPV